MRASLILGALLLAARSLADVPSGSEQDGIFVFPDGAGLKCKWKFVDMQPGGRLVNKADGTLVCCKDCTVGSDPCAQGSPNTNVFARKENGTWKCSGGGGGGGGSGTVSTGQDKHVARYQGTGTIVEAGACLDNGTSSSFLCPMRMESSVAEPGFAEHRWTNATQSQSTKAVYRRGMVSFYDGTVAGAANRALTLQSRSHGDQGTTLDFEHLRPGGDNGETRLALSATTRPWKAGLYLGPSEERVIPDPPNGQRFVAYQFGGAVTGATQPVCTAGTGFTNCWLPAWAPSTSYPINTLVKLFQSNLHRYRATSTCISGASEPAFNTGSGSTTSGDGTCSWLEVGGDIPVDFSDGDVTWHYDGIDGQAYPFAWLDSRTLFGRIGVGFQDNESAFGFAQVGTVGSRASTPGNGYRSLKGRQFAFATMNTDPRQTAPRLFVGNGGSGLAAGPLVQITGSTAIGWVDNPDAALRLGTTTGGNYTSATSQVFTYTWESNQHGGRTQFAPLACITLNGTTQTAVTFTLPGASYPPNVTRTQLYAGPVSACTDLCTEVKPGTNCPPFLLRIATITTPQGLSGTPFTYLGCPSGGNACEHEAPPNLNWTSPSQVEFSQGRISRWTPSTGYQMANLARPTKAFRLTTSNFQRFNHKFMVYGATTNDGTGTTACQNGCNNQAQCDSREFTPCTSGSSEPAWDLTPGSFTRDNTCCWRETGSDNPNEKVRRNFDPDADQPMREILDAGLGASQKMTGFTDHTGALNQPVNDFGGHAYHLRAFGAVCDGQSLSTGSMASGNATLIVTGANFTNDDVGKLITVAGAGTSSNALYTTIASVGNATTVTLAATAGTTVSNVLTTWGTNDAAAFAVAEAAVPAGSTLLLPPNAMCRIGTGRVWTVPFQLRGAGRSGSVLDLGAAGFALTIGNGSTANNKGAVSDLTIQYHGNASTNGGIRVRDPSNYWTFERLTITNPDANFNGTGMRFDGQVSCNCNHTVRDVNFSRVSIGLQPSGFANLNTFANLSCNNYDTCLEIGAFGTDTSAGDNNRFSVVNAANGGNPAIHLNGGTNNTYDDIVCDLPTVCVRNENGTGEKFYNAILQGSSSDIVTIGNPGPLTFRSTAWSGNDATVDADVIPRSISVPSITLTNTAQNIFTASTDLIPLLNAGRWDGMDAVGNCLENNLNTLQVPPAVMGCGAFVNFPTRPQVAGDPIVSEAGTETLTNKTLNADGTGNVLTTVEKLWLPAARCDSAVPITWFDRPTTNPAVAGCRSGTNTTKGVLDFSDQATNTDKIAFTHLRLPDDWTGAVDVRVVWETASASVQSVVWNVATACAAELGTDDPAFNGANAGTSTSVGANTVGRQTFTGITMTGCDPGELLYLKISRDADNGADTLTADARLIGIEVTYRRAQ